MPALVATAVGVDAVEDALLEIEPAVGALIDDPHRRLGAGAGVGHAQAAPAGVAPAWPDGPAEGRPAVLLAPRQRLVGVPRSTESADSEQVPVVLGGVVNVVSGPHVGRRLGASQAR